MEAIIEVIQNNIYYAPYIILGLLLLAGFNLPVSEDLMLFTSGILAAKHPEMKYTFFLCVFLGCYLSDIICYFFFGRFLGQKIFKIPSLAKMVDEKKLGKIAYFYERYGIVTLIVGRFIPFGVRNALFISAGLAKMPANKFALSDFIACSISSILFFSLYYTYGESVIEIVKRGNLILFTVALLALVGFYIKKKAHKKN